MPIDRPDGRHWCNPAAEQPDDRGQWTCPGCGTQWFYTKTGEGALWETAESREQRLEMEKIAAEAEAEEKAAQEQEQG